MSAQIKYIIVVLVLSASSVIWAADSGEVSGSFILGDTTLSPNHILAVRHRDGRHDRTVVVLSNTALDKDRLVDRRDTYTVVINDPALDEQNYLTVFVRDDGGTSVNAYVDGVQYLETTEEMFGEPGSLKTDCPKQSAEQIECRVWVDAPVVVKDGASWTLDVSFAASVIPRLSGTPIAADGGEAGVALMQFVEALEGDDLDAVLRHMSEEQIGLYVYDFNTPEENLEHLKSMWSGRLPKELSITGGEQVSDGLIFLEAEGELFSDSKMVFEIAMRQRNGRWVVDGSGVTGFVE